MQLGVSITDAKGKIVYANPADAEQHGYSVEELIGKDVGAYAPAGTRRPLTPEQLKQLRHRRRQGYNARRDGSVFPVQLHSDVVLDAKGEPIGVITSCEDITERRVAEQELQNAYDELRISHTNLKAAQLQLIEAEKLESVGRLAAGVAHEVKNPLMTILTGVQYLTRFVSLPDPAARQLLDDMRDAVQRADSVIRGLLDFSAPRALECAPQNVNDIVERSLPLIKHEADRAQVTITTELGPALPALSLDGFKIQQVLINLITNAIHATPPGGSVTVRTAVRRLSLVSGADRLPQAEQLQSPQRAVFIEVEDTGSGIPEEALNKVFDPFYTTKPTGKGTGLGLSVTRQIVEMHHGSIHLENRLGAGARATVVLRVESEEATDGQATHPGG
jgi:PAS domain S-box-containing protein